MPAVDQAPPHGAIVDPSELAAVPGSMLDAAKAYAADVLSLPAEPPRTLPVTPAERACATVLRAWLEWTPDANCPDPEDAERVMMALGDSLADRGFLEDGLDPTPAGAALLARVEAAPVLDPMIAFEAAIRDAAKKGGPYCATHAREAVAALDAARLAGTTPIDAPPAKEPAPLLPIRACKHPRATGDCYSCPDCGVINNCNLENGEPEAECQMCPGKCPNRAQYAAKEPR